jgi:hypothetical protein
LGRFLSPDPHIYDRSNAQNYNRYSYVNNNPVSSIDPTGFRIVPCVDNCNVPAGFGNLPPRLQQLLFTGQTNYVAPFSNSENTGDGGFNQLVANNANLDSTSPIEITGGSIGLLSNTDPLGNVSAGPGNEQDIESDLSPVVVTAKTWYIVVSFGAEVSPPLVGGSLSTSFLWDPNTTTVNQFFTSSGGPGIGMSATGGVQTGIVALENINDFTGWGAQLSGVAAWNGGMAGTAVWGLTSSYGGAMAGPVGGSGASASLDATYTWPVGTMSFSQAPAPVQAAFCNKVGGC